jgi:leucyl aminopeptidase
LDDTWPQDTITAVTLGWALGSYQFTRYKKPKRSAAQLLISAGCNKVEVECQALGLDLTRNLINTPAQDMMPEDLAEAASELANIFDAKFTALVGHELLQNNYPVIHAVGRASAHPPQLLDMHWGDKKHPKLTLVGKGVCFDSGGLDLKPASGMRWMKKDLGGAAHGLGLATMIMSAGLPVRLRVLIPAVENAVAGNAFRPGDVLTSRSGKTIEIDNTDAEGRLVLCDALAEAIVDKPDLLIDMATLTGAARVALGPDLPAIFGNRQDTAFALLPIAEQVNDPLWPMPLHQAYKRWLHSDIADLVNSSSVPLGGAITAALFLQAFVPDELDWLHMDVMAFNNEALPGRPKGGEAMGLRSFFAYISERFGTG